MLETLEPRLLFSGTLPTAIHDLLVSRLDDPVTDFAVTTVIDASTTALHAEFNTYFTATDHQIWRANINGDDVVDILDQQLFSTAMSGGRSDIVAIDVPDGTHSFSLKYDDAGVVAEVFDDWLDPLFARFGLTYDPADDPAYADLFETHIPTFFYANLSSTTWGKAYAFTGDAIDFSTGQYNLQTPVNLNNLGLYDPETGDWVGDNFDETMNGYRLFGSADSILKRNTG